MLKKKIATFFLIFTLVFHLLPVKQAVQYFFVDNPIIEEIIHLSKNATKNFRFIDEDHNYTNDLTVVSHLFTAVKISSSFHYNELLPVNHITDILTPPPNNLCA